MALSYPVTELIYNDFGLVGFHTRHYISEYSMHVIQGATGDCPDLPFVLARECSSTQATQRVHTIVELILDNQKMVKSSKCRSIYNGI